MSRKNEYKPIPEGTRFGKLTVKSFVEFDHRRRALFECVCDCGTTKTIIASLMRNGGVKSCGCLPAERMKTLSASLAEDLSGKRFGKLTVIRRLDNHHQSGSFLYECRCDCGNLTAVNTHHLNNGMRDTCKAWVCRDDFSAVIAELNNPSPDPIKDAYFGGHFDGEGCLGFVGESYFPHLSARVGICYKPTLFEYQKSFGGQITRIDPRRRDTRWTRIQWKWEISAQHEVYRFVHRMLPYVKEKLDQFQLASDFLNKRAKVEKYNAGPDFVSQIPMVKARMSELKKFEFKD